MQHNNNNINPTNAKVYEKMTNIMYLLENIMSNNNDIKKWNELHEFLYKYMENMIIKFYNVKYNKNIIINDLKSLQYDGKNKYNELLDIKNLLHEKYLNIKSKVKNDEESKVINDELGLLDELLVIDSIAGDVSITVEALQKGIYTNTHQLSKDITTFKKIKDDQENASNFDLNFDDSLTDILSS